MVLGFQSISTETLLGMVAGAGVIWYMWNKYDEEVTRPQEKRLRRFTKDDLSLYSGKNGRLCYVAIRASEKVYDVTSEKQTFLNKGVAGTIVDDPLAIDIDVQKLEKAHKCVGTIIIPKEFTLDELREFDGRNGKPVYVAAKGIVYEVDPDFYGPEGPYGVMAGRDASRALALVSLDTVDVDNNSLEGLSWSDLNTLDEWVAKFEFKYNRVGYLVPKKTSDQCMDRPKFLSKTRKKVKLVEKIEISHDTRRFRFELPETNMHLGLPVGKHIKIWCPNPKPTKIGEWNRRADPESEKAEIERKYTPSSLDEDNPGYFDLVIKVYRGDVLEKFPDGGKMSQYFDQLRINDSIEVAGPFGLHEYKGRGIFRVKKREVHVKNIGMLAGGTGITPMLQIISAVLRDIEDETKLSLVFANQTEEDILVRDMLEDLAGKHPTRFKLWYTVDRPGPDWKFSKGFIDADMIRSNLPPPSDDTLILMCGPPPMVKFACKQNLDKLGYKKELQVEF